MWRKRAWRPVVHSLDARLAQAPLDEAEKWKDIRAEILAQYVTADRQRHRRRLELIQVGYRIGFAALALLVGAWLAASGFDYAGLLVLGATLYQFGLGLVPRFIPRPEARGLLVTASHAQRRLLIGFLLTSFSIALLIFAHVGPSRVGSALMLIAGMTVSAALSAFQEFIGVWEKQDDTDEESWSEQLYERTTHWS